MAIYGVNNTLAGTQQNQASTYKTALAITALTGATTLRRAWIYEFEVGADGVPNSTDCPIMYNIQKGTAGTQANSTAVTPNPVDMGGGDAAALISCYANFTTEPTYASATSSVFYLPLNQRASQKQIFRDQASSIVVPAVTLNGPAFTAKSPNYASTIGWHVFFQE